MILSHEGPVNADTPVMQGAILFIDIVHQKRGGGGVREGYHSAFLVMSCKKGLHVFVGTKR
jgi:hypothetical protein